MEKEPETEWTVFYSDDEERTSLFGSSEVDGAEVDGADKPSESRIRNL